MEDTEPNSTHPAFVSDSAIIASEATVHAGAWIGPDVTIEAGVVIGPGAILGFGNPLRSKSGAVRIGEDSFIGPSVIIEPMVEIGPSCMIESGVLIRPATKLAQRVYVGDNSVVLGDCIVESNAVISLDVHICQYATLRSHCQLMPGVKLLNDKYPPTNLSVNGPTIGECAIIGVNSIIWPGVQIGYHGMVASASEVKRDVPDYTLVRGCPAKPVCDVRKIRTKLGDKWVYPYPWMRHRIEGEDITKPAF